MCRECQSSNDQFQRFDWAVSYDDAVELLEYDSQIQLSPPFPKNRL